MKPAQPDLFGPTYVLTLRASSGHAGVRNLRALLKIAWRHFGLRAINVRESGPDKHPTHRRRSVHLVPKPKQAPQYERSVKMDMRQFKKPKFLKVEDIRSTGPRQMRIAGCVMGQFKKPDLVFESGDKLGLSATNAEILSEAYSFESEEWAGHLIELYVGKGTFEGEDVDMVLVRPISKAENSKGALEPIKKPPSKSTDPMDKETEF
jgi:hypothetical protein